MKNLLILLFSSFALSQTTIPHITDPGGSFTSVVTLTNTKGTSGSIGLHGYTTDGADLGLKTFTVPGHGLTLVNPYTSFANSVSHLVVEAPEGLLATVTYQAKSAGATPATVTQKTAATTWHVLPGDWSAAWDGIAVVNLGTSAATVRVIQRSSSGAVLQNLSLGSIPAKGKRLVVASSSFASATGLFEILSDSGAPLAITALRGTPSSTVLWENAAQAATSSTNSGGDPATGLDRVLGVWVYAYTIISTFTNSYAIAGIGVSNGVPVAFGFDEYGDLMIVTYDPATAQYLLYDPGAGLDRFYFFQLDEGGTMASGCYYQGVNGRITSSCYATLGEKLVVNSKQGPSWSKNTDEEPILEEGDPDPALVEMGEQAFLAYRALVE